MRTMAAAGLAIVGVVSAGAMGAQVVDGRTTLVSPPPVVSVSLGSSIGGTMLSAGSSVKGEPYSLKETTVSVRTLVDGTTITHTSEGVRMRDAEGRTRMAMTRTVRGVKQPDLITIFDPVDRLIITVMPFGKEARVTHMAEPKPMTEEENARRAEARARAQAARTATQEANAVASTPQVPMSQVEKLPERTIAGVTAEGKRVVRVTPVDADGNDRELRAVSEIWSSPELKIELESTVDDPINGKSTTTVTELERSAPDPAMFQVPEGYKVIDSKNQ